MPEKKWYWNDIMDGLLRRLYDPTVRGRSQEIAAKLKVPRWTVNRRAAALGLSRRASTFIAAPPRRKFATIWAVTDCG